MTLQQVPPPLARTDVDTVTVYSSDSEVDEMGSSVAQAEEEIDELEDDDPSECEFILSAFISSFTFAIT